MEYIFKDNIKEFINPGIISRQIINGENSSSTRITMTEVHVQIGACQPRHIHETSEQIWYAIKGKGKLLLQNDETKNFTAGDVVRFNDGDVHGLLNDSNDEFIYISVTSPPINFRNAYKYKK